MIGPAPVCLNCVHFHEDGKAGTVTCDAFPTGIPDIIWTGGNKHAKPVTGDHGIRFTSKDDKPKLGGD